MIIKKRVLVGRSLRSSRVLVVLRLMIRAQVRFRRRLSPRQMSKSGALLFYIRRHALFLLRRVGSGRPFVLFLRHLFRVLPVTLLFDRKSHGTRIVTTLLLFFTTRLSGMRWFTLILTLITRRRMRCSILKIVLFKMFGSRRLPMLCNVLFLLVFWRRTALVSRGVLPTLLRWERRTFSKNLVFGPKFLLRGTVTIGRRSGRGGRRCFLLRVVLKVKRLFSRCLKLSGPLLLLRSGFSGRRIRIFLFSRAVSLLVRGISDRTEKIVRLLRSSLFARVSRVAICGRVARVILVVLLSRRSVRSRRGRSLVVVIRRRLLFNLFLRRFLLRSGRR